MSCYVREMTTKDLEDVKEIDREAFPTQWPAPNYGNELRNKMAHFIVACDGERPVASSPETAPTDKRGRLASLFGLFGRFFLRGAAKGAPSLAGPPFGGVYPDRIGAQGKQDKRCIVGFVGFWIMAGEAHITSIAVREKYRRRGIGELLLFSAIDMANELKADIVTLEVRVSNTPAQNLYRKYGFTQMGLRRAYYTDNREDAFIMSTDKIASPAFQARFQQLKQAYSSRQGQP